MKKYKFYYWFASPALHSDPSWTASKITNKTARPCSGGGESSNTASLAASENSALVEAVQTWSYGVDARQRGFFLARRSASLDGLGDSSATTGETTGQPELNPNQWTIAALSSYESGFFEGAKPEDCFICFVDPSNYAIAPGWMLRNLLVLVKHRWGLDRVQILRYRDIHSMRDKCRSTVTTLESKTSPDSRSTQPSLKPMPKVTGWERNPEGKLTGRMIDLTEYLDPKRYDLTSVYNESLLTSLTLLLKRLADQSVDLNLKLMKWRISPNLELEKIKKTRCLLLGAGTLGSYVARNLMVWLLVKYLHYNMK